MPDTSWKRAERAAAQILGGARNPLSGSTSLHTSGDVIHPALYVESKYRKRHGVASLMRSTAVLAKKEGKLPIVFLKEAGSKGGLIVVRSADLAEFVQILFVLPVEVNEEPPRSSAKAKLRTLRKEGT